MKKLLIIGKGDLKQPVESLKKRNNEIWMCGTDIRTGGDKYFELHGIRIKYHDNVIYKLPDQVYKMGFPINNTVSALVVYAYLLGYTEIKIIGCPMKAKEEYIQQRPALSYIVGYMKGKGLDIQWTDLPENTNYGKG